MEEKIPQMLSQKPYLIRALYEWVVDCDCTPYVAIKTDFPRVDVPMEYAKNNQIVFNVSPLSIKNFIVNADELTFVASFGGSFQTIYAPIEAVIGIYAMENGQGMFFQPEESQKSAKKKKIFGRKEKKDNSGEGEFGPLKIIK